MYIRSEGTFGLCFFFTCTNNRLYPRGFTRLCNVLALGAYLLYGQRTSGEARRAAGVAHVKTEMPSLAFSGHEAASREAGGPADGGRAEKTSFQSHLIPKLVPRRETGNSTDMHDKLIRN